MKPFADLLVIEMAGSVGGGYCGKLFADFGATVVKVEPPGGDPQRGEGQAFGDWGTTFAYINTNKRLVEVDLESAAGTAQFDALLAGADVLIESSSPLPLHPIRLSPGCDHLVRVFVSPFGIDGPYAGFASTPFTDYAAGGHMYLSGEPDREPLPGAGRQPEYAAGTHAFIGALAALRAREFTGAGQSVDVSHMETMASLHQWTTVRWSHGHFIQKRIGNRYDTTHPITVYPCKDGFVGVSASSDDQGQRFIAVTGVVELLDDPRFANGTARLQNWAAFDDAIMPWLMSHTSAEIVRECQEARVPVGPVPSLLELLDDEHLSARGFWKQVEGSSLRYPGPPFRMSGHEWKLAPPTPASLEEVTRPPQRYAATGSGQRPLEGVRILDLSRVWAGPLAARILGDLGADVIRIEAPWARGVKDVPDRVIQASKRYPNNERGERPWNREGMSNKFNRNKRGITLDLANPVGKSIFEDLVAKADVVIENYSPRVMPQLGLGYDRLKELNPGIIYIGMPGFGWDGPNRDYVAYGTMLEPAAGLSSMMGYPGTGPYKSGVAWADPVAGMHAAAAVMLALHDRAAAPAGEGQAIELAQLEGMICFIGEELLASQVRGSDLPRIACRSHDFAPQGCYRSAGDDAWLALTVTTDGQWRSLCSILGATDLASLSLAQRQASHDAIDARISAWSASLDHHEATRILQDAGIPAFPVLDAKELLEDPHLNARDFFPVITHPDAGTYPFPGLPIRLSATPASYRRPAPGLGEHNDEVHAEILGMSGQEIASLAAADIIVYEPPR